MTDRTSNEPTRLAGVWWILAASASFALMGALVKAARPTLSITQIIFWRCVVVAVVSHGLIRRSGATLRPGHPGRMFVRCAGGLTAMFCFFYTIGRLPLGTATTLQYTSPVFTVLLAGPLLGERPGRRGIGLVALAFVGVLLILRPSLSVGALPLSTGLLGGLLAGLVYVVVRQLRATDPPSRIVWWFAISGAVLTLPVALAQGLPADLREWLIVAGVGLTATGGQVGMTQAYRVERASVVGPFSYATVVLSTLAGMVAFDETIEPSALVGTALFVTAGALLARSAAAQAPRAPTAQASNA